MTRRMSFSQALALLEARGIPVEHLGRLERFGCLMWRVGDQELDKSSLIDYAERVPAPLETVVLVACTKQKRLEAAPARELYTSEWFTRARAYAENFGDRWYILSALYGLLAPEKVVAPYDLTIATMAPGQRAEWGRVVAAQLRTALAGRPVTLQLLAGRSYRDPLVPHLDGYTIEVPMAGLGIGQQIAWLGAWTVQEVPHAAKA